MTTLIPPPPIHPLIIPIKPSVPSPNFTSHGRVTGPDMYNTTLQHTQLKTPYIPQISEALVKPTPLHDGWRSLFTNALKIVLVYLTFYLLYRTT